MRGGEKREREEEVTTEGFIFIYFFVCECVREYATTIYLVGTCI